MAIRGRAQVSELQELTLKSVLIVSPPYHPQWRSSPVNDAGQHLRSNLCDSADLPQPPNRSDLSPGFHMEVTGNRRKRGHGTLASV